ncbi:MAG TPA: hypothetical protein VEN29_08915 [Casimicrobiaceae bacterium]|nr:hypothetical protein [Casimicrobiaceae bacterium]
MNFAEWFLRDRFMDSAAFYRHYRRYKRAVHPLIAAGFRVQETEATSDLLVDRQVRVELHLHLAGARPGYVARQLGHANTGMLFKVI